MNIIAGILVLIVGFIFHWLGQLVSVVNWEYATKLGIVEEGLLPEYKVYDQAFAVADSAIGWIYGIAGVGLLLDADWGYKLAWLPGWALTYHGIDFWFYSRNQIRDGNRYFSDTFRIVWTSANIIAGVLTILVAWNAC